MHGDVSLQRDSHRHEDGRGHGDGLRGVQHVGEEHDVDVGGEGEAAAEALQDAAEQEETVEADQGHEKQVEAVPHFISGKEKKREIFDSCKIFDAVKM